jgi:hypothetical protein
VKVVSFRIPHCIFSGPESLEFFYESKGLFKFCARCHVYEFAVLKLPEHAIHGSSTRFCPGWIDSALKLSLFAGPGSVGKHGSM